MLQVKTKEQLEYISKILCIAFCTCDVSEYPIHSIQSDVPITFDEMAAIVDYIRHCNATERKQYISEFSEDWNYRQKQE